MRLTRVGGKKDPVWRVVVADRRSPRDGRFIETLGRYNPQTDPSTIVLNEERVRHWLASGAQPTEHGPEAAQDPGHRPLALAPVRELLEYLARSLVDQPDEVKVEEFEEDDGTLVLELSVAEDDYGTGHRPRRTHRPGAPHGRQGRRGQGQPPRPRRHRRVTLLEAGRVGRPHGLDGSFHVTRPDAASCWRGGGDVVVAGARGAIVRRAGTDEQPILRLRGLREPRGRRGAARRAAARRRGRRAAARGGRVLGARPRGLRGRRRRRARSASCGG